MYVTLCHQYGTAQRGAGAFHYHVWMLVRAPAMHECGAACTKAGKSPDAMLKVLPCMCAGLNEACLWSVPPDHQRGVTGMLACHGTSEGQATTAQWPYICKVNHEAACMLVVALAGFPVASWQVHTIRYS
jgi:hypothetical protein